MKGFFVLFCCLLYMVTAQINPSRFYFKNPVSVNGSSDTANCSNYSVDPPGTRMIKCDAPLTSVLFDGVPTFTGADGAMWASSLLVLQAPRGMDSVTFDFSATPGYQGVREMELVMFNCPERGIHLQTITVRSAQNRSTAVAERPLHATVDTSFITSCVSLVRICTEFSTFNPILTLQFSTPNDGDRVYLAETTFYTFTGNSGCTPGPISTPPDATTTPTTAGPDSTARTVDPSPDPTSTNPSSPNTTTTSNTSSTDSGTSPGTSAAIAVVIVLIVVVGGGLLVILGCFWLKKRGSVDKPGFLKKGLFRRGSSPVSRVELTGVAKSNGGTKGKKKNEYDESKVPDLDVGGEYEPIPGKGAVSSKEKSLGSSGKGSGNGGGGGSSKGGGGGYEDIDEIPVKTATSSKEKSLGSSGGAAVGKGKGGGGGGGYEDIDEIPVKTADSDEHTYNVLRENDMTKSTSQVGHDTYSHINDMPEHAGGGSGFRPRGASEAAYSTVNAEEVGRRATSPSGAFNRLNNNNSNLPPPKPSRAFRQATSAAAVTSPPQPQPDAVYAEIDKPSPTVPAKNKELAQYLETKPIVSEGSPKVATLTRSVVSSTAMSDNPVYAPTGSIDEIVYAEPGVVAVAAAAATAPEEPGENIYEQIYSETLSPSSFNDGSRPSDVEDSEDLYHYSAIYSAPSTVAADHRKPAQVTWENVKVVRDDLGSGNFGAVLLARTVGLSRRELGIGESTDIAGVSVLVAVKQLKDGASVSTRNLFEKECLFMSRLDHANVVRLLGVCKTGTRFIMMEYMENGDLNQFLRRHDRIVSGAAPPTTTGQKGGEISEQQLVKVCRQISSGMSYLASRNFVHRDLATRNCLVSERFDVKVADFGMSRNLYDSHYYVIKGQAVLPIRWMASECFYGQFSAKTDIWAFGATMWEVFELAKHEPYHEMLDMDLVRDACRRQERKLLSRPQACPEAVYDVMLRCWCYKASDRATFQELHESLSSLS